MVSAAVIDCTTSLRSHGPSRNTSYCSGPENDSYGMYIAPFSEQLSLSLSEYMWYCKIITLCGYLLKFL